MAADSLRNTDRTRGQRVHRRTGVTGHLSRSPKCKDDTLVQRSAKTPETIMKTKTNKSIGGKKVNNKHQVAE